MYLFYSLALMLAFVGMSPLFLLRRQKYAAGLTQRLGNYPEFNHDGHKVIWLHCVSVGETNAARPLVDQLRSDFPAHRVVISTTTLTGQNLARSIFKDKADAVFYFPFDWKFSVRRALSIYKPSVVLLMETEIWPRFIRETKSSGSKVAIVNGRLSHKSHSRYSIFKGLIRSVLDDLDLALMQSDADAKRIISLGADPQKVQVTGNLKFDLGPDASDSALTAEFRQRFAVSDHRPLIVAASTHEPEERWVLDAYCSAAAGDVKNTPRLLIAPRHPERFDAVARLLNEFRSDPGCEWTRYTTARRSAADAVEDAAADIILLDSIGELRSVYPLAEIVFVGGSLIPHGGQSVLEPAAAGKAIVTGPHTFNFEEAVRVFLGNNAVIQLPESRNEVIPDELFMVISDLLEDADERQRLGTNAASVMKANRGATARTVDHLRPVLNSSE